MSLGLDQGPQLSVERGAGRAARVAIGPPIGTYDLKASLSGYTYNELADQKVYPGEWPDGLNFWVTKE